MQLKDYRTYSYGILQYDLEGNLLNEFGSYLEAINNLGYDTYKHGIAMNIKRCMVMNGKSKASHTYKNYMWIHKKFYQKAIPKKITPRIITYSILVYGLDGKFLYEFNSIIEASVALKVHKSLVSKTSQANTNFKNIKGEQFFRCGKFYCMRRFNNDEIIEQLSEDQIRKKTRVCEYSIIQLNKQGYVINEFKNLGDAIAKTPYTKKMITLCICGSTITAGKGEGGGKNENWCYFKKNYRTGKTTFYDPLANDLLYYKNNKQIF